MKKIKWLSKLVKNYKLSGGKKIILSIVALLEVLLIITVSTFSWIETISSIAIKTNKDGGNIDVRPYTVANLNAGSYNTSVDLSEYFRTAGNVHLSPASSADGKNFFFPGVISTNGKAGSYRKGTINDINVNYISFTCEIKLPTTSIYEFFFREVPEILVGEDKISNNDVRIAVSLNDSEPKIYSMSDAKEQVVSAVNGDTTESDINSFESAIESMGGSPVFTVDNSNSSKTQRVTVTLWLQSHGDPNVYTGKAVKVNHFSLGYGNPKFTVNAYAVTNGTVNNKTGGMVAIDTGSGYGDEAAHATDVVQSGTTVSFTASAQAGYTFEGWYRDSTLTSSSRVSTQNTYQEAVNKNVNLYAKFSQNFTINISADSTGGSVGFTSSGGYVSTHKTVTYGSTVSIYAVPKSGYSFSGWYSSSADTSVDYSDSPHTFTVNASTGSRTYYAKFKKEQYTTTIYFEPRSGFTSYNAYIYDDDENTYNGTWSGNSLSKDSATGYYKCSFKTDDQRKFYVIISNNGSNQYPASGSQGLTGTCGNTYLFKAGSPSALQLFDPTATVKITFDASSISSWVGNDGCSIFLTDKTASKNYSMTKSGNTFTATVPSTVTNIEFYRSDSISGTHHNTWSAGDRGSKTKYVASSPGTGSWQ